MSKKLTIVVALSIYIAMACVVLGRLQLGVFARWLAMCLRGDIWGLVWLGMILLIPALPTMLAYLFWERSGSTYRGLNKAMSAIVMISLYLCACTFSMAVWMGRDVYSELTTGVIRPDWLKLLWVPYGFALLPTLPLWRYFSKKMA